MKKGSHVAIAANQKKSDAFTKAREPKRILSTCDSIDDSNEIQPSSPKTEKFSFDKV